MKKKSDYREINYLLLEEIVNNKQKRVSTSTSKGVLSTLELFKTFLSQNYADYQTQTITSELCARFSEYLDDVVKQSSKRTYLMRLAALFSEAVEKGLIEVNPLHRGPKTKLPEYKRNVVYLTKSELQKLLDTECFHTNTKNAFIMCCYTGLSLGDIESLEWKHIIFDNGQMMIVKEGIRNKKEIRIPVVSPTKNILLEIKKEYDALPKEQQDGRVFHLYSRTILHDDLEKWQNAAGISKKLSFNVARHTFGTLAVSAGVSLYTLVKWMGLASFDAAKEYLEVLTGTHQDSDISALEFVLS